MDQSLDTERPRDAGHGRASVRANSRAALLQSALEEFTSRGYEAATVASIAERAGVTTGALYAHFSGKLELLLETVGLAPPDDVVKRVAAITARPWQEAAPLLSQAITSGSDERATLLLDVIVVARREPKVAAILRQGLEKYLTVTKRAAEKGSAAGLIDPVLSADDLTRVLAVVSLGALVFDALGEPRPSPQAFTRLTDLVMQSADAAGVHRPAALMRVEARRQALQQSQAALLEAIAEAAAEGHSLRSIAAVSGLSHERVRRLLADQPAS